MYGMGEGLSDIFVQPYKGAQKEGTLGAVKGVGKGTVSLITKTGSGKHPTQFPISSDPTPIYLIRSENEGWDALTKNQDSLV
jgi:hypothetical protein